MKNVSIFTGTGPVLILTTYASVTDPNDYGSILDELREHDWVPRTARPPKPDPTRPRPAWHSWGGVMVIPGTYRRLRQRHISTRRRSPSNSPPER